jgi:hypothetical protein
MAPCCIRDSLWRRREDDKSWWREDASYDEKRTRSRRERRNPHTASWNEFSRNIYRAIWIQLFSPSCWNKIFNILEEPCTI